MASACAQYEPVVACLSSAKRSPAIVTAQMLLRVSPNVPSSEVIDASSPLVGGHLLQEVGPRKSPTAH